MSAPWQTRSEFIVDQALENALAGTPDQLRKMRPVAAPQDPFPDRVGYSKAIPTINDVLNVDRYTPTYRSWISGMPVERNIQSDYTASGSRNVMSEGWR